jgi:hypothetical protein
MPGFLHFAALLKPKCDVIFNPYDARPSQPVDDHPANGRLPTVAPNRLAAQTSAIAAVRTLRRVGGRLMRRTLPTRARRRHAAPNRSYRFRARLAQKSALRLQSGAFVGREQIPADIQGQHDRGTLETLLYHLCRKLQASVRIAALEGYTRA